MRVRWLLLVLLALWAGPLLIAQGCTACRDATAGSAPQVRKSLRRAIPLLGIPAIAILAGTIMVAARTRPGGGSN